MLTFRFTGAYGAMVETESLTSGMVGKTVKLEFSEDWEGLRKTAVFTAGEVTRDVVDVSDVVTIPAEVLETPLRRLYVGVCGVSADGSRVTPTIRVQGPEIEPGVDPSGDTGADPGLPVWAQLQAEIDDLKAAGTGSGAAQTTQAALVDYDRNVKSVNHRGYNTAAPENTIPAYILSKKHGFRYVECDVSFTSDGVAVLLHDSTIDRTSDGSGSISSMTYAEASQYDYGSWKSADYAGTQLPTLDEFLRTCKGLGLHPYIEIKNDSATTQAMVESIVAAVRAAGMKGKVSYISFNATYLGYVKTADPAARLGYVVDVVSSGVINTAAALKLDTNEVFIDANYSKLTDALVTLCINADLPLEVWTANSESWIGEMNPYISGVTSDSLIAGKVLYEIGMVYGVDSGDSSAGGESGDDTHTHSYTSAVTTAAACDTAGVRTYTCSCGHSYTEAIPATGHNYVNGACTVCNGADPDYIAWEEITLTSDDLMHGCELTRTGSPYYGTKSSRASYVGFDLRIEPGYVYQFDYESTVSTAQIGCQFHTTASVEQVSYGSTLTDAQIYDPGWGTSGRTVSITEDYNGYPISCVRLTFRADTSNSDVPDGMITSVKITRTAAR